MRIYVLVPKTGFEPAETTTSTWRVYQFHHLGSRKTLTCLDDQSAEVRAVLMAEAVRFELTEGLPPR